jgi:hypothetical protein
MKCFWLGNAVVALTVALSPVPALAGSSSPSGSITVQSDANTLATALGPGVPSSAVVQQLDSGNDAGLVYSPALLGGYGSFTAPPPGRRARHPWSISRPATGRAASSR